MKQVFLIVFAIGVFSSCATVNINGYMVDDQVRGTRYGSILLLYSDSEELFYEWDEESYNFVFHAKFNDLDRVQYRKGLTQQFIKSFQNTRIYSADNFFPIHKPIPYEDFMQKLEEIEVDAIMVVQNRASWQSEVIIDGTTHHRPNVEYHFFLLDKSSLTNVWMANLGAYGAAVHNNSSLYSRMTRSLNKELREKRLVNNPTVGFH